MSLPLGVIHEAAGVRSQWYIVVQRPCGSLVCGLWSLQKDVFSHLDALCLGWQTERGQCILCGPGAGTQEASDKGCSLQTLALYADTLIGNQIV